MNKFIETVKEENRETNTAEDMFYNKKIDEDTFRVVMETINYRYKYEIYLLLNNLNKNEQTKRK